VDKFDFGKIASSVNWPAWLDWTILIDLSGFALAIIGFLNLADPIERYFRTLRDNAEIGEKTMNETIKRVFPLHKNWWRLFLEGLRYVIFPILPASFVAAFLTGELNDIWQLIQSTHWGWLALITTVTPFGIFVLATISRILANRLVKYVYWIVWRVVSILAYPPSGVLGTIGLAITLTSLSVKYLN
jgi:hypothetical protein